MSINDLSANHVGSAVTVTIDIQTAAYDGYITVYCDGSSGSNIMVNIYDDSSSSPMMIIELRNDRTRSSTFNRKGMRFAYASEPTSGCIARFLPLI